MTSADRASEQFNENLENISDHYITFSTHIHYIDTLFATLIEVTLYPIKFHIFSQILKKMVKQINQVNEMIFLLIIM